MSRLAALLGLAVCFAAGAPDDKIPAPQRIVFVGDSITDGHTYPLLVRQALAEAEESVPLCINAGVAGDTAAGMKKRLERDVLPYKPNLVTLSVGINDVLHKVPVAEYEADVTAIAERLKTEKIPLLILTTSTLKGKNVAADERLADYNAALRRVATQYGCKVAEVNKAMREARDAGKDLLQPDDVHLNFEGYRVLTRALLDALGHPKVPVPAKLKLDPVEGLVPDWQIRPVGEKEGALDETAVAALKPDGSWKALKLPQTEVRKEWWEEQERQRGFAQGLDALAGKAKGYVAIASVEAEVPRDVFVNTGGSLQTVWLNGKRIYKSEGWTGWHLGKERLAAHLQAGRNVLVVETGPAFALSVTSGHDW